MNLKKDNRRLLEYKKQKAGSRIVVIVARVHQNFAAYLNKRAKKIPASKMKIMLFIFCGLSISFSAYLLKGALSSAKPGQTVKGFSQITGIRLQKDLLPDAELKNKKIQRDIYLKVQRLKSYIDSVKSVKSDSDVHAPGFNDSIRKREEFLQKKQY